MIKCNIRLSVSALIAVLLTSFCLIASLQVAFVNVANAVTILPVEGMEYANGTIVPGNAPFLIWYDWIDVCGTQIINYAIYTTPNYGYPVPIGNLIGQHFRLEDGTQFFIASALSELEVYKDLNGDGIPQADFTELNNNELLYMMYINMSEGYNITPIEKTVEDSVPHYRWDFTYENVHGFLQDATARIGVRISLILSHITLSYDFSVNGNVSNLKTNFDVGEVTSLIAHDAPQITLDGLSLSLLYATATYTSDVYTTYVDGEAYNSATAEDPAVDAELAQVQVEGVKAYDFVFGGNYTLNRGENNETHKTIIGTYEAKAEAAALFSIPFPVRTVPVRSMSFFRDQLNLEDLFGGSWEEFKMNYESSSLIYRICFPVWDGMRIEHDPVYVAYFLSSDAETPQFPSTTIFVIIVTVMLTVLIIGKVAKTRKSVTAIE